MASASSELSKTDKAPGLVTDPTVEPQKVDSGAGDARLVAAIVSAVAPAGQLPHSGGVMSAPQDARSATSA
jgi:hypothetical protein